ncbi:MAG: OmpA family protein, partial [Candidatus Hydrogenedentota bacterium]
GKYREVKLDIPLKKIETGVSVVINNIFFKPNSAYLSRDSRLALDRIAKLLKTHYNLALEIQGHTDDIGSKKKNLILSQKRAEAVRRYLMKKGISGVRLKAVGFGEEKPRVPNTSAKNRALNRRIEFKIIKVN